jgi:MFS family permease
MSGAGESLRESKNALAEVFRNPNLRRLNLALAGSVIGDWALSVGAAVYAYTKGGATAVGVVGVVRFVTMALLAPFTSLMADKFDRKAVMIAADAIRTALVLLAALVIWRNGPPIIVYALAVLISLAGTAFRPAQAALMPSLANHPGELTAANVASSTIHSVGFFVGPAIGGLLLAVADIATVYVFDAVTFVWSALLVIGLHPAAKTDAAAPADAEAEPDEKKGPAGMFAGVGDGYREILRSRDIRLLIGLYCAQTVVAGASLVFSVAIALDLLKLDKSGVGVLDSAVGVGGVIGGVVALLLAQRGKLARDFGIGVVLWAAPLLLIAAWPALPAALIAMAIIGVANSVVDVNAFTILQRLVPDAVMGRVFGAMESAIIGGMALGALVMPILIHTIGLRSGLVVVGGAVSGVVVLGVAGLRRIDKVALAPEGLDLLKGVAMLGVLPETMLERLARGAKVVTVASGQAVFSEGDGGDLFYVIESGTVDVTIRGEYIRTLSAGGSFGEIALLRDVPRTATVTATSDLVARAIERDHFLAAVTGHGDASEQADIVVGQLLAIR